jgi:hypothetical protein
VERVPEHRRWRLLGVKYVVTWRAQLFNDPAHTRPAETLAEGGVPDEKGNVTKNYRLDLHPRRAFLVHDVEVVPDEEAVYARLAAPDFDPLTAVLLPQSVQADAGAGSDQVRVLIDAPGHLRFRTDSRSAGVLVVSEVFFPGWRVRVDGIPASLLRADGALLAVGLPAGTHEVEFVYRPPSLLAGGIISATTLLILVGLAVADRALMSRR